MDVTTLYLFDGQMALRATLLTGVSELIHKEGEKTLSARIPQRTRAATGEYLGMRCVDGRFRLFAIDKTATDDLKSELMISATDAAVAELADSVTTEAKGEGISGEEAVRRMIAGTAFTIGHAEAGAGRKGDLNVYYVKTWAGLEDIGDEHDVRVIPYYEFGENRITGRKVDVLARKGVYRGRILTSGDGASGVTITRSGRPVGAIYATGAATGTSDPPARVTLADAAWSTVNGDPADKPKGQAYIVNPAVTGMPLRAAIFVDEGESDPQKLLKKAWEDLLRQSEPEVSGTATAQDMEMIPGMAHKAIRIYDKVAVRTRAGEAALGTVIEIARDYVRPDLTKFTIGAEKTAEQRKKTSLASRVASIAKATTRLSGSGAARNNRIIRNEALIQLNAEAIQMNAETILAQAEQIQLKADYTKVNELGEITNNLLIDMDAVKGEILLKASQSAVDGLGERVASAEGEISVQAGLIDMKASQTDLDGVKTEVGIELDAFEDEITLKADKVYVDAEITKVKTLIADEIDAAIADLDLTIGETVVVSYLTVKERATLSALALGGENVSKTTLPVVTSFTQASGETAGTTNYTLLTTSAGSDTAHTVAGGQTKAF